MAKRRHGDEGACLYKEGKDSYIEMKKKKTTKNKDKMWIGISFSL